MISSKTLLDDNFHRPDTAIGAAGSTTAVGTMYDVTGAWNIQGNMLRCHQGSLNNILYDNIYPSYTDCDIIAEFAPNTIPNGLKAHLFGSSAIDESNLLYVIANVQGNTLSFQQNYITAAAGYVGQSNTGQVAIDLTHAHRMTYSIRGSSPTSSYVSWTDMTTNTVLLTCNDNGNTCLIPVGRAGLAFANLFGANNNGPIDMAVSRFAVISTNYSVPDTVAPAYVDRSALSLRGVPVSKGTCGVGFDTHASATFKVGKVAPATAAISNLSLVYGNWRVNPCQDGPNAITVKAAIEYPEGVFHPVYFGADGRTTTIQPGGTIQSRPCNVEIPAGEVYYVRTFVTPTSGGQYPICGVTGGYHGGYDYGGTDKSSGGGLTLNNVNCYEPFAILGTPSSPITTVATWGTSIAVGTGDDTDWPHQGYPTRALWGRAGHVQMAVGGSHADQCQGENRRYMMEMSALCDYAIIEHGTNDINNPLSQIQSDLQSIAISLARRGVKVYCCTTPPRATVTTDGYATVSGQTVNAQTQPTIDALNAWKRSVPLGFTGCFEVSDALSSARDSGKWKAGYTADGVHPSAAGHAAAASVIDLSKLPPVAQPYGLGSRPASKGGH